MSKKAKHIQDQQVPRVSEVEVMTLVRDKKIRSKALKDLKKLTSFSDVQISSWLHINVKTFRSYRDRAIALPDDISEQVYLLLRLFQLGKALFSNKEQFDEWLSTENFYFDEVAPMEFLSSISGIRFISSRLRAMEMGDNV